MESIWIMYTILIFGVVRLSIALIESLYYFIRDLKWKYFSHCIPYTGDNVTQIFKTPYKI